MPLYETLSIEQRQALTLALTQARDSADPATQLLTIVESSAIRLEELELGDVVDRMAEADVVYKEALVALRGVAVELIDLLVADMTEPPEAPAPALPAGDEA